MRIPSSILCLLTLLSGLGGCSQTAGFRSNAPSNVKTVASVGDKPLPIVSGEPGSSSRADSEEEDLPPPSGSRISGRVYDDRGKTVSNAKVRLAVGSAPGGKIISARTDRSGAFTLKGLRPGSSYTVIAESQGDDDIVSGRAQAKAPQTDLRITLQSRDGESEGAHASIRPARPRVEPISNVDPGDDEGSEERGAGGRVNNEDMDPPPDEAATLLGRQNLQASRQTSNSPRTSARGGWNARQNGSKQDASADGESIGHDDRANSTARASVSDQAPADVDDDGPNPLPPALEPSTVSSTTAAPRGDDDPIRMARSARRSSSRSRRETVAGDFDQRGATTSDPGDPGAESAPRPIPSELLPGERVITPGSYGPIVVPDPQAANKPLAPARPGAERVLSPDRALDSASTPAADSAGAANSLVANEPAGDSRRPTWRDLSPKQADVPLDESIQRATGNAQPSDSGVITLTSATRPARSNLSRLLAGPRPTIADAVDKSVCQIDLNERRLVDFKLPDTSGKLVSLHDIDADVILLDFWGSWCEPCAKSITHLIEQQEKLAGQRFEVIGIACEKGATSQERRASAAKAAQTLGIHYPVLVSSMDGSCPVQKALQIQFYPTMVLVDREGHLLAREQGATDATLPRIDRAIASALRSYKSSNQ